MPQPTNPNLSIGNQVIQVVLFNRELKLISEQLLNAIDGVNGNVFSGRLLTDKINSLADIRTRFPVSTALDARVRVRLADDFPDNYANPAAVTKGVEAMNTHFDDVITALNALSQVVGTLVDTSGSGVVDTIITSPKSDALKTVLVGVIADLA